MLRTVAHPRESAEVHEHNSPSAEEVRQQLRNLLASPAFHGSKRCQQFLEFVCEKSVIGEGASLKERTLAVEVFGRRPQADLGEDTIVRVSAREVRKRLALYYVTPEGAVADVVIYLPSGSYAPEFRYARDRKEKEGIAALAAPVVVEPSRKRLSLSLFAGGLALLAAIFAVVEWTAASPAEQAFGHFWEPVFRASEPLLLAVGHPIVYLPSRRAFLLSEDRLPPQPAPMQRAIQLAPNEIDGSDMIPVFNQHVGFGDMVAATEVASMLARKAKGVRIRLASSLAFADLRQEQTLLIGAVTNRWTMELEQNWRFQFRRSQDRGIVIVDTTEAPGTEAPRQWGVTAKDDGSVTEDYILVCRIRNSTAGGLQIVAAGVKQFGTEAAGRLLTDHTQLGVLLSRLPAGWETKNLQIVLHVKVIGNSPAQPELEAWNVW